MKVNKILFAAMFAGSVFAADQVKPAAPAAPAAAEAKDDIWAAVPAVVAEINGKNVTKEDIVSFMTAQMPDGKIPPMINGEFIKAMLPGIVKSYVNRTLIQEAAKKAGFTPSEKFVVDTFQEQIKKASPEELEAFKQQLAMTGKTLDTFIAEKAKDPKVQEQFAIQAFIDKEVIKSINITDEEAKAYYDKNTDQFTSPADPEGSFRASHILYAAKTDAEFKDALAKAQKTYAILKADPSKFEEIAKDESSCPSKAQGGSLGAFSKGQMVKEFEDATVALKNPGDISEPIKTQFGYHIIRKDAPQLATVEKFDAVKADIIDVLKMQKMEDSVKKYIAELEAANKVKYLIEIPKDKE